MDSEVIGSRAEFCRLMILLLETDPNDLVKAELDNFCAYEYIEKTPEMQALYDGQPSDAQGEYDDRADEYLDMLKYGDVTWSIEDKLKEYKQELENLVNKIILS